MKVECFDLNAKGQGVCKIENKIHFVDNLLIGEEVKIKVIKEGKKFSTGEVTEYIKKSPDRNENSLCKHYNDCGGCNLMHLNYEKQLEYKYNKIESTLKKIGKIENPIVNEIVYESDKEYRNKSLIHVDKKEMGFYKKNTHDIINLSECLINDKEMINILNIVKEIKNNIKRILFRYSKNNKDFMIVLVTKDTKLVNKSKLLENLCLNDRVVSIYHNVHEKMNNIQLGKNMELIYGRKTIDYKINGIVYELSPRSFFQINDSICEKLYKKIIEIGDFKNKIVVDAYCGIGSIGLNIAKHAKKVIGIEIVRDSIKDAKINKEINDIKNIEFIIGKVENEIEKVNNFDSIILDPPRSGCDKSILKTIVDKSIKEILYVSCDVASLSRDIKFLIENGYELNEVTPFDMFPNTAHVECLAKITKKEN